MAEVYSQNVGVMSGPRGVVIDLPCNQNFNAAVSGLAFTGSGLLHAVILTTATGGSFIIFDNTSAAGTQLLTIGTVATGGVVVPIILDALFTIGLFVSFGAVNGTVSLNFRTR